MHQWQQRVVDEKRDLDDKIAKLRAFIESHPDHGHLSSVEQLQLGLQLDIMRQYSAVLTVRIDAFPPDMPAMPTPVPVFDPTAAPPGTPAFVHSTNDGLKAPMQSQASGQANNTDQSEGA